MTAALPFTTIVPPTCRGLLVFDYTVSAHDYTTDLKVTALNQNGAAIFDSAGNVLDVSTGFPFDVGIGINSFNSWKAGKIGDWSTTSNWCGPGSAWCSIGNRT